MGRGILALNDDRHPLRNATSSQGSEYERSKQYNARLNGHRALQSTSDPELISHDISNPLYRS